MSNIFSNRFFQGGIAIAVIGISFFAYQSLTGEITMTDIDETAIKSQAEAKIEGQHIYVSEGSKVETAKTSTSNKESIIIDDDTEEKTTK